MTSVLVESLSRIRSPLSLQRTLRSSNLIWEQFVLSRAFSRFPGRQSQLPDGFPSPGDSVNKIETDDRDYDSQNYKFFKTEPVFPIWGDETKDTPQNMVDAKEVQFIGGHGGHGVVRFTSLFAKQFAGPDGGDGGNGGHVVLKAKQGLNSLDHLDALIEAPAGEKGDRFNMHGKKAEHVFIEVPVGTMVRHYESNEMLADLIRDGQIYVAARGGGGGKGNASFLTNESRAPDYAEEGAPGEDRRLYLEMRTIADVGLIGFPNAGKSTFLRGVSRARPKTAPYQFTTLCPHVGVVHFTDETTITFADIPGIIPGAHQGHGLGLDFLRHVQRCKCLLYVIDLSVENVVDQLISLRFELEQFQTGLSQRPQAIIGNKIDEKDSKLNLIKLNTFLEKEESDVILLPVSGRDLINVRELLITIKHMVDSLASS